MKNEKHMFTFDIADGESTIIFWGIDRFERYFIVDMDDRYDRYDRYERYDRYDMRKNVSELGQIWKKMRKTFWGIDRFDRFERYDS